MTTFEGAVENSKYKLLGFENDKRLAVIMVIATGKVLKIKLSEVLSSEMMDNFNKMEIKNLYKKFYSQGGTLTAYDINDRNENSWMIYIILNLLLFTFYIFTSIAATKPIYLESLGIIVTPGTLYSTRSWDRARRSASPHTDSQAAGRWCGTWRRCRAPERGRGVAAGRGPARCPRRSR